VNALHHPCLAWPTRKPRKTSTTSAVSPSQNRPTEATVSTMSSGVRGNDRWLLGALVGGVGVIAGAALPWLETGGVARSVFTLARVASELGLLDRPGRKLAIYSLLGVPLLVPLALIALSVGLRKVAGLILIVIGLLGTGSGAAGLAFGFGQVGPPVALAGGLLALVAAAVGAFRRFPTEPISPIRSAEII
jgi:hypothetical protein